MLQLHPTCHTREIATNTYRGYTELNDTRYVLKESHEYLTGFLIGNHILFSYELDGQGAQTGFTDILVKEMLNQTDNYSLSPTFGGWVNREGLLIEEKGFLLTFDKFISPVELGACAYKIVDLFRQYSVMAIYESEVTFVYA